MLIFQDCCQTFVDTYNKEGIKSTVFKSQEKQETLTPQVDEIYGLNDNALIDLS